MRFIADGPDIPDELLVARDAGRVILFCGAGVSQAEAELPNFAGLASRAIESLGAAQDSRARVLLERALALEPGSGALSPQTAWPRPQTEVASRMTDEGISRKSGRTAKVALGVISTKKPDKSWEWSLPPKKGDPF